MFETVSPETFRPRSRRLFYESLPVSIALHGVAILGVILVTTWKVEFPLQTPRMLQLYSLEQLPTPPPPPPPAAPPKTVASTEIVRMPENVAPTIIPDTIIPVTDTPPPVVAEFPEEGVVGGVEGGIAGGIVGGSPFGIEGGELGGVEGGTIGAIVSEAAADTVVVRRDMPLPTAPMSMVFPKYPENARVRGWEDIVVVRYTIGKNGRVRDVVVLNTPERDMFREITLKAIRNWRFKPHKVDGIPQEIVHELTVYFKLNA